MEGPCDIAGAISDAQQRRSQIVAAWCPVSVASFSFSSQLSVASSQFSVSQLRRFRRLFALRNQGRSRRRRYPGMVGFFAKIRCAHSFAPRCASEQQETRHSCNRFLRAWKSQSPAGIALPLFPAGLYGRMHVQQSFGTMKIVLPVFRDDALEVVTAAVKSPISISSNGASVKRIR